MFFSRGFCGRRGVFVRVFDRRIGVKRGVGGGTVLEEQVLNVGAKGGYRGDRRSFCRDTVELGESRLVRTVTKASQWVSCSIPTPKKYVQPSTLVPFSLSLSKIDHFAKAPSAHHGRQHNLYPAPRRSQNPPQTPNFQLLHPPLERHPPEAALYGGIISNCLARPYYVPYTATLHAFDIAKLIRTINCINATVPKGSRL
jgi:hypothetical protein